MNTFYLHTHTHTHTHPWRGVCLQGQFCLTDHCATKHLASHICNRMTDISLLTHVNEIFNLYAYLKNRWYNASLSAKKVDFERQCV